MQITDSSQRTAPASDPCRHPRRSPWLALIAGAALPHLAVAQNLDGMLRGILQRQASSSVSSVVNGAVNSTFRSVTNAVTGRVTAPIALSQETQGKVILYRTSWCGYCRKAASYMQSNDIPFVERDVEANAAYSAEYKRLGGRGVPLLVFGDKTLNGYSEQTITQYYREMQPQHDLPMGARHADTDVGRASPPSYGRPTGVGSLPQAGDTLTLKLSTLNIYEAPSKTSSVLARLTPADDLVYLGEEHNGLYRVASSQSEGWVDKLLVRNR